MDRRNHAGFTWVEFLVCLVVSEAYEAITKPIIDRMVKAHEVAQELTALRDWLLPMLMNVPVTVRDLARSNGRKKGKAV